VLRPGAGDAAPLLLGAPGLVATGTPPLPAVLDGAVDLLAPVDLGARSTLRLAVDGGDPVDVDVAGVTPSATLLEEVLRAVDAALPGVAQVGPLDRLRLVSPTAGPGSSVEVVPVRHLEVVEYPPTVDRAEGAVAHGSTVAVTSSGFADVPGRVEVATPGGIASPRLADPVAGWSVQVDVAVDAGATLLLEPDESGGVRATVVQDGSSRPVDPELVHVLPSPRDPRTPAPLTVRRGRHLWSWTECDAARFDDAVLDTDRFAGGPCTEEAVFDVSRFSPTGVPAVLAATATRSATAQLTVTWDSHRAGAFEVNLPGDLDPRFGRAFDEIRFGSAEPERLGGVVTEPLDDDDHVVTRVNSGSRLVEARLVPTVPIGFTAVALPFRDPSPLTLGRPGTEARLYVSGPGLAPGFLELRAAEPGAYGNDITVSARLVGPEIYDLEIHLPGGRFENACAVVFGRPLPLDPGDEPEEVPTRAAALLAPGPVGVGTAKAAGVRAHVTRDRVPDLTTDPSTEHDGLRPHQRGPS
jgi:hypothetical protein